MRISALVHLSRAILEMSEAEELGEMLHEAFGEGRKFHQHFGYHADIIRPKIAENFPTNWEERVIPLPNVERVKCLDPHDMAAAKCRVARPKDAQQLEWLAKRGFINLRTVRTRPRQIPVDVSALVPARALLNVLEKNL